MCSIFSMSRRQFLEVGAAAAAGTLVGGAGLASPAYAAERLVPRHKIGIQLFTVRDLMAADVPGTLRMLGDIGYAEVETAGLFGYTPAQFAALLRAAGLKAIGG